jgi:hypothetical protein
MALPGDTLGVDDIDVIVTEDPGFRSFRSSFKSIGARGSQQYVQAYLPSILAEERELTLIDSDNKWLQRIDPISKFIRTVDAAEEPAVKIAIIDDGIDASLERFDGKIVSGTSFYSGNGLDDSTTEPYFVPSGDQHGTFVAAFVLRVFPRARLYVAKLDEKPGGLHGKRHITARSAADVSLSPSYIHAYPKHDRDLHLQYRPSSGQFAAKLT